MEGTRRGKESARKIFERDARSVQRKRENGWKGRVQDANGMMKRKERKTEKKEREKYYQRNGYASEEVE
jgi:hypothetical protein